MSEEIYRQFFPGICAGLGLFLAGGVNLLLLQRGFLIRAMATFLAFGIALISAAVLERFATTGIIFRTVQLLGIGLVMVLLLGCGSLVKQIAVLIASLQRPVVRFGLLTVVGIGLVIGTMVAFDRAEDRAADKALANLELLNGPAASMPVEQKATTDRGTAVILKIPITVRDAADLVAPEDRMIHDAHLDAQIIRRGPGDSRTNCHGWVFTGGRFILSPDDVELILKENGYQEVQGPQSGDLVIYRQSGKIAHSAIIRYVSEGQPALVESKWGNLGVFLHPADKSTYGMDYTFYRSPRSSHLLAGVGGPASTAMVQTPITTE